MRTLLVVGLVACGGPQIQEKPPVDMARLLPATLEVSHPREKGEAKPAKFILTPLARRMTKKEIVRIVKERWRTERAYEELKGELGLDHFEGRSFPGWHHHISVVLCCYAFLVSERVRRFPPSARRQEQAHSVPVAA